MNYQEWLGLNPILQGTLNLVPSQQRFRVAPIAELMEKTPSSAGNILIFTGTHSSVFMSRVDE